MRRTLPQLLLAILALSGTAAAQIAMPEGVALSPFPVSEQPAAYSTFADGDAGVWAIFQGARAGSALYAQHLYSDGAYAPGFSAKARAITRSNTLVNSMWAAPDGVGGAAVVWFGVNPKDSTSQFVALRLVRFDAQGDIASTFSDTGVVVSSIASAAMVVGDGLGGCYVVWEELKSASNPDIVAQHYNDFGAPTWIPSGSPTGRNVCAVVGLQRLRAIQEDGSGGAYVVWADNRSPTASPLYAMRLTPAGVAGAPWTTNGVLVTPITPGIRIVGSATTPSGGLWLAWRDINVPSQCMGQRLRSDASFAWGPSGVVIAAATPARADFVRAGSSDVFVTWGGSDIRCARMDSAGVRLWPESTGRVLIAPTNSSANVRAVADGAGGQRLAWSFDNAGQTDVNILRVDGAGNPWPNQPPLGVSFADSLVPEEPVGWFQAHTATPQVVWLSAGVMRVRRLPSGTTLGVGPEGPRRAVVLAPPAPNPLRGVTLALRFSAPQGPARLELFDAAGRRLLTRAFYSNGGPQALQLDEAARLAPGVYTLRLAAAGHAATQRLVRVE